ncbi:MAG: glycoside hydrolase family 3 N-terminal domain-containing protein [Eubacteriales bacterium]|nr:glycoside hydrolase family 3 N-terminal domain-containing protein [Eubacteriales bacterium]
MMDIEKRIEELLSQMTLEEKIGQLTQRIFKGAEIEQMKEFARKGQAGSYLLGSTAFGSDVYQERPLIGLMDELQEAALESRLGIPLIYGRDVIHGHRTVFPIPLALASSFNPDMIKKSYRMTAEEASDDGIHWTFAPMLDVSRDPRWGRCIEGPGEDPYLGSIVAKSIVTGFQGDNEEEYKQRQHLAACAKHYIGYGASEGGRDYHRAEISDYSLRNYYLPAFKAAVDSGVATVMSSFNEVSGEAVTASEYLLKDLLKTELGFDGFVVTDWGAVWQLILQGRATDRKDAARLALNGGSDMDMEDNCYWDYLAELALEGKVPIENIDEAVRRILRIKLRFGIWEKALSERIDYDSELHYDQSKKMAEECMVLLKNEDNILPLKKDAKIALIGPMVNARRSLLGSWTLDCEPDKVSTIKEAILSQYPEVTVYTTNEESYDNMISMIYECDTVVLALGESYLMTGEGKSLAYIDVPKEQEELVKKAYALGKPMIATMTFGRPIGMQSIEPYLKGIIYTWHSGSMTAPALADILFGKVNPSGKLAMTLPRVTGQIPLYYNPPRASRRCNGYYGDPNPINYQDVSGRPMYPFGYGLSYTTFEYSNLTVENKEISLDKINNGDKFAISVEVTNTGDVDGMETVQLYIHDKIASMTRPIRELKGFKKVMIKKGESARVTFNLGYSELGFYGRDSKYNVELGEFDIYVGGNCYADLGDIIIVK